MKLRPHPHFERFRQVVTGNGAAWCRSWKGLAYRCAGLQFARAEKLTSGEGTRKYGARWMAPGAERVVHLSTTEMTAIQESRGHFVRYGLDAAKPEPRVLVTLEVEVGKMLDLVQLDGTDMGCTVEALLDDDWEAANRAGRESLAQALGRAAFSLRYEALLAPSALHRRRRNLVIFPENLAYQSRFAIAHEDTLREWLG